LSNTTGANVEFVHYGEVLRRRWFILVAFFVLGLALAVGALFVLPKTYQSTASVLVSATGDTSNSTNGRTSTDVNLDTEAQIVTSSVVAKAAGEDLGSSDTPRALAKRVSVTVPANTSVLAITYAAGTKEGAQAGAKAFADAYLKNREGLANDKVAAQRDRLQKRIDDLGKQLLTIGQRIQTLPPDSAERSYEQSRRALLVRQIASINEQYVNLDASETVPGSIITDPQTPTAPASPNVTIIVASGGLLGLLVGVLVAFWIDRRDRRIRGRRDLVRLGLDPMVPSVTVPPAGQIASPLNTAYDPEGMRMLRNALLAQMPGHRGWVMVASASRGTAGSAVSLNLAATLARTGLEVILVSADSHVSSTPTAGSSVGLADVLQQRASVGAVLQDVKDEPNLRLVAPGLDGSLYSELVQSERVHSVLEELGSKADVLLVDVAPVSENADAQTLASQFDGVILVAQAKKATLDDLTEAVDQLRHVSARIFGAVVAHETSSGMGHERGRRRDRHDRRD
jgi:Mrp family chromosome partitioning ATPase/capsular polysaccharide biosynthesis protein